MLLGAGCHAKSSVLVIGDSTTAYCMDRKNELHPALLSNAIQASCGVVPFFQSMSGAHFSSSGWTKRGNEWHRCDTSFLHQLQKSADAGWRYDFVLLVGGWNEVSNYRFSLPYLYRVVEELTVASLSLLRESESEADDLVAVG